eukprot:297787_1
MVNNMVQHSALIAEKARNSMISLGYYRPGVVDGEENSRISKRKGSPLSNRCSWARAIVVEGFVKTLLRQFQSRQVQVVNLGSGLCSLVRNLVADGSEYLVGFDVDTAGNRLLAPPVPECCGSRYQYLCGDLRCPHKLGDLLVGCGMNTDLPIVIVMECVLMYLKEEEAVALLEWIRNTLTCAFVVVFDLNSHSRHGKEADGFIKACQQLWSASGTDLHYHGILKQLLENCGWPCCWACDVAEALHRVVSSHERQRVYKLEDFDEYAPYATWLAHYSIAVGCSRRDMLSLTFQIDDDQHTQRHTQPLSTLGLNFRYCRPTDMPAVIDLIMLAQKIYCDIPTVKRFFQNQPAPCLSSSSAIFVATVGGGDDIVGTAQLSFEGGEIRHIYVHKNWRRREIATQLMDLCIYVAKRAGLKKLVLTTLQHIEANLFYDALDWDYVSSTPLDDNRFILVNRGKTL